AASLGAVEPAGGHRRVARPLMSAGAVALLAALGSWWLQSSPPTKAVAGATTSPLQSRVEAGARARASARPSSPVVLSAVDPVLWGPRHRPRTAATLRRVLGESPSAATGDSAVEEMLTERFPHSGTEMSTFGTGSASAAISGVTLDHAGIAVTACDRPCVISWTANIVVVRRSSAGGQWNTRTATTRRTATGSAAAFVPLQAALALPPGTSSVDFEIRTQPGVRFLWALHLDER
ncbi:hypothetical protein, partial [Amnibacterium sp.]|uniref:hypothetical protein n=1 Tax=Amnibacterium sp. TaxID=1872496 RepID=UPI00261F9ED6